MRACRHGNFRSLLKLAMTCGNKPHLPPRVGGSPMDGVQQTQRGRMLEALLLPPKF